MCKLTIKLSIRNLIELHSTTKSALLFMYLEDGGNMLR